LATPKDLVRAVSAVLGTAEATVTVHDRNLALAGLRTVGGRGLAAAMMTSRDAANLLVAVAASNSVKDSAKTVREYHSLRTRQEPRITIKRYAELGSHHSFIEGLTALIDAAAHGETPDRPGGYWNMDVHLEGPRSIRATIEWKVGDTESWVHYSAPHNPKNEVMLFDLEKRSTFTHVTILSIGAIIGGST
jgi:hypothetical protein